VLPFAAALWLSAPAALGFLVSSRTSLRLARCGLVFSRTSLRLARCVPEFARPMDVTCERCSTAYEFDDALVSERGTTVKCTNCGHQFKVRRPQPLGAPERWLVRTIDGRELEFRALRELQGAIAQALITRDDVLSRGGSRPRRLGSIAELEPFFVSAGSAATHATSLGLGPRVPVITGAGTDSARGSRPSQPRPSSPQIFGNIPAARPSDASRTSEVSIAIPLPRGPESEAPAPKPRSAAQPAPSQPRRGTPLPPAAPPATASGPALPGVIVAPSGAPPIPGSPPADDGFYDDTTRAEPTRAVRRPPLQEDDHAAAPPTPAPSAGRGRAPQEDWAPSPADALADEGIPVSTEPAVEEEAPAQNQHTASVPPLAPAGAGSRNSYADDLVEPRFSHISTPRRAGAARWIVGLVVVGMMVLAFATVGRRMLVADAPAKTSDPDARIGTLLAGGEKSLADGDLESAKEQFDKASVLGEGDPRAVADLARLAAAKADIDWLRVRLLPPGDPDQATANRELEQNAQRARKAADRAGELAPTDPAVVRSHVDALRLAGDVAGARKLVGGLSSASTQPDNALALAELDLGETKPDWPTVLGRLRAALSTDGNLGRARSMLVYALARSGDGAAARTELERLGALPRPHPLLGALRAYVSRSISTDPNALPDASAHPGAGKLPAAATAAPREPKETHEPKERERPWPEPREPRERPAPEEHVVPAGPIDTSDLPGVKAPPTPPPTPTPPTTAPPPTSTPPAPTAAPPPASTVPPGVDTSDLPGFK
jgi:predicted Zn finger-like uncharacterized protein